MKCPVCSSNKSWVFNPSNGGTIYCNSCGNNKAEFTSVRFITMLNRDSQADEAQNSIDNKQRVQCEHSFVPLKRVVKHCVKCAVMETDGLHYTRL